MCQIFYLWESKFKSNSQGENGKHTQLIDKIGSQMQCFYISPVNADRSRHLPWTKHQFFLQKGKHAAPFTIFCKNVRAPVVLDSPHRFRVVFPVPTNMIAHQMTKTHYCRKETTMASDIPIDVSDRKVVTGMVLSHHTHFYLVPKGGM